MIRSRYRRRMAGPTAHAIMSKRFDELDARTFHDIVRLRCDVFVVEQECAYPELDGRDTAMTTMHHWIADGDDAIVAYARTLDDGDAIRIGRVVTAPRARGRGLAADLVGHLVETTGSALVLDAQSHLADWYRRFGFETVGDEFDEDGILHVPMRLVR